MNGRKIQAEYINEPAQKFVCISLPLRIIRLRKTASKSPNQIRPLDNRMNDTRLHDKSKIRISKMKLPQPKSSTSQSP
jgi:hypothetical protein